MIQDFYIRDVEDPYYRYNVLEHSDPIESIITKIKMIMGTTPGQVLGDISFGKDIESKVFDTKIGSRKLEEELKDAFQTYISETTEFDIRPSVQFGKADGYDYAIIDIYINGDKSIGFIIK